MFSGVRRFLYLTKVTQSAGEITVEGLPADTIAEDILKTWGSTKIANYIFNRIGRNSFSFLNFFAPDIHYALSAITRTHGTHTRQHAIDVVLRDMEENTWLKRISEKHPSILNYSKLSELNISLLDHQHRFLEVYDDRIPRFGLTGYLLSAVPGTGKTIACLALSLCLNCDKVYIISPKNATKRVWKDTLVTRLKKKPTIWIAEDKEPYKGEKYIIVHYEALEKALEIAHQSSSSKPIVLLDESHNMNEESSNRTQHFIDLCKTLHCQHVIWSSGTPLKAMGYEMIPILRTIDPLFTTQVEERFRKVFGMASGRAVDILRNRIGLVSFKVTKAQVVTNSRPISKRIDVKLSNGGEFTLAHIRKEMETYVTDRMAYYQSHMHDYEELYKKCLELHEETLKTTQEKADFHQYQSYIAMIRHQYIPEQMKEESRFCNNYELKSIIPSLPSKVLRDKFKDARSVIKYVYLKVFGEALGKILGKKRVQCHLEMIPHMGLEEIIKSSEKKTVIFTSFVEVVKATDSYLRSKGFSPILVYGEAKSSVDSLVGRFEKSKTDNPLIATYQSLSTAVPLIMANSTIFTNATFRDYEMVQAKARTDRLGQDAPVRFFNVFLDTGREPNISTRAEDILAWSKAMVDAMLGSGESGKANKTLDKYFASPGMEMFVESMGRFEAWVDSLTTMPLEVACESLKELVTE